MTAALPHCVDRTIVIDAFPNVVFQFFTDNARWATWWGAGSTIEPHVGGRVYVRHPNGVEVIGEVTEISPPERIAFTYGYATGKPFPPDASHVTIHLEPVTSGTRLRLHHAFVASEPALEHIQGWRFQLSLFSNAVANDVHRDAEARVDAWFEMWSTGDTAARDALLERLVAADISMRDRFSHLDGLDDLRAHLAAVRRFMPGVSLVREGEVRQCQGVALANWVARAADGQVRGKGTNVFRLDARNRVASVTGLWSA